MQNFFKIFLDFSHSSFKPFQSNPIKILKISLKFYWPIFHILQLLKILKLRRKFCSVSISNKYFFKSRHIFVNVSQNFKEIFSNISIYLPKISSTFCTNFTLKTFNTILLENFSNNILLNNLNLDKFYKKFVKYFASDSRSRFEIHVHVASFFNSLLEPVC